jgi:hypothetical protein
MNIKDLKVKTVQFAVGIDLLGSKLTLSASKNNELEATPYGIMAHSVASKRYILIPYPNCKGIEFVEPKE